MIINVHEFILTPTARKCKQNHADVRLKLITIIGFESWYI
jgi:hypothetical protein